MARLEEMAPHRPAAGAPPDFQGRRPAPALARLLGAAGGNTFIIQLALLAATLALWQWAAGRFDLEFWISSPLSIIKRFGGWYESGQFMGDLTVTLIEAGAVFVIGSVSGGFVGFVLGWVKRLGDIFEPFVLALYTLPKIALAPLFVLWFGIGIFNKIMFSTMLVFFMVFFTTFQGTRQVDRELVVNARLLGASSWQIWTKIAIPHAAIWLFAGIRIGLPYALIGAIVGEFIAAENGIGFRIRESTSFFDTAGVFAGLVALMGISLFCLAVLRLIEKRALRWQADTDYAAPRRAGD